MASLVYFKLTVGQICTQGILYVKDICCNSYLQVVIHVLTKLLPSSWAGCLLKHRTLYKRHIIQRHIIQNRTPIHSKIRSKFIPVNQNLVSDGADHNFYVSFSFLLMADPGIGQDHIIRASNSVSRGRINFRFQSSSTVQETSKILFLDLYFTVILA